jgi:hypothetical protein
VSGAPPIWTHRESDPGLGARLAWALGDARLVATMVRPVRSRAVRSLAALTLGACAALQGREAMARPLGRLDAALYPDEAHTAVASALARTLVLLPRGGQRWISSTFTHDGGFARLRDDDPQVSRVVVEALSPAGAAAIYLAANPTAYDRADRQPAFARMIAAQARAVAMATAHAAREHEGTVAGFEGHEKGALAALEHAQRELVRQDRRPWPRPFAGARETSGPAGNADTGSLEGWFTSPNAVQQYMDRVNGGYMALDLDIQSHPELGDYPFRLAWGNLLLGWRKFYVTTSAIDRAVSTAWDTTVAYDGDFKSWRDKWVALGGKPPPPPAVLTSTLPSMGKLAGAGDKLAGAGAEITSNLTTLAVVIGGLFIAKSVFAH